MLGFCSGFLFGTLSPHKFSHNIGNKTLGVPIGLGQSSKAFDFDTASETLPFDSPEQLFSRGQCWEIDNSRICNYRNYNHTTFHNTI